MRFKMSLYFVLPFIWLSASGQRIIPREINLVFNYLKHQDYPEKFNDKSFQVRPVDWQIIDIDDDGTLEVFLQTFPHYLESPTITIFQIAKNDSVTRILEGLVPGRLLPLGENRDYYFDPHTTGTALDSHVEKGDSLAHQKFAHALIGRGMSAIIYKNFIHADHRNGAVFVDLRYLGAFDKPGTCQNFQFAKPDEIIVGRVNGSYHNNFVARVDNELFCYEITGFVDGIYLKKRVRIRRTASDFEVLVIDSGFIKYRTTSGEIKELTI
jgi:hypothetical protein